MALVSNNQQYEAREASQDRKHDEMAGQVFDKLYLYTTLIETLI